MTLRLLILASGLGLAACSGAVDDHADIHTDHAHTHGENCGHVMVKHDDHWDYLHDGHLHHVHGDHVDEHVLAVTDANPAGENPLDAASHAAHQHGANDTEHPLVPHGDHFDHVHDGRLHHVHGDHVDDHGPIDIKLNG